MTVRHKHLIVRAEIQSMPGPDDVDAVIQWARQLVARIGMKLLMGPYATYCSQPGNKGLTLVAIIETSHISVHIWDESEPGLLQMDVYSCAEFDPTVIFETINDTFQAQKIEYKFLNREHGLQELQAG